MEASSGTKNGSSSCASFGNSQLRACTGGGSSGMDQSESMAEKIDDGSDVMLPPIFTEEDERAERAALTPDEIRKAERDLRGITAGVGRMGVSSSRAKKKKSKASRRGGGFNDDTRIAGPNDLAALELELAKIPAEQKIAYTQAWSICPEEISADRKAAFLERDDLDPVLAARRLVLYWSTRYETFGAERCFLPMTLTGAMQDEVAEMSKFPSLEILPHTDEAGRAMMFLNMSTPNATMFPADRVRRICFYMKDTLTTDTSIRRAGWVGVASGRETSYKSFSFRLTMYMTKLVNNVLPIKMRACHVFNPSPAMHYVVSPAMKYMFSREMRLRWVLHVDSGDTDKFNKNLEDYNLSLAMIPKELGGQFEVNFARWVGQQSIVETALDMRRIEAEKIEANTAAAHPAKKRKDSNSSASRLKDIMAASGSTIDPQHPTLAAPVPPIEERVSAEDAKEARAQVMNFCVQQLLKSADAATAASTTYTAEDRSSEMGSLPQRAETTNTSLRVADGADEMPSDIDISVLKKEMSSLDDLDVDSVFDD
mmetsp:Transcript_20462/g.44213  ORF Transcript_20462/g.44213 Transcript_20462/m.44213 type:complete len:540 (-) Transcript_20462:524-2143(-)